MPQVTRCKQCKAQKGKSHKFSCSYGRGHGVSYETVNVSSYTASDYGYDSGSSGSCGSSSSSSDSGSSGGGCD